MPTPTFVPKFRYRAGKDCIKGLPNTKVLSRKENLAEPYWMKALAVRKGS